MASPSPPQTHKKNQDKSGRMGGLMHLFDFNHALAGRKTPPTDKKPGGGVEAPRNSLDVGGSILETPRSSTGRSDEGRYNGWDLRETLSTKKPPANAKAAQDMSKDQQVKNRSPSVVARLMGLDALPTASKVSAIGLDALPTGSMISQKSTGGNAPEKSVVSKLAPDRPRHTEKLPQNAKLYARKARAPLAFDVNSKGHNAQESDWESDRIGPEPLSFRNHPQEHQLQEFKKEFAAWQSRKVRGDHPKLRSSKAIDLDAQLGTRHILAREKSSESKPMLAQDKTPSPKSNVHLDRLHETKEFLDAMDFLQSNKEFFMKFLQEPNSIFARHVLDSEISSQTARHRRKYQTPDATEEYRPELQGREPIDLRRNSRNRNDYSQGDTVLGRIMMNGASFSSEDPLGVHDQQGRAFSSITSQGRLPSDSRMPTRIVVLKPSPGKAQSQKTFASGYPRSPKDHEEFVSEESKAVIERLREKLRKDMTKNYKNERRSMGLNVNEHCKDNGRDPREIAREIARQIRENVSKDLGRLHNVSLGNNETRSGRRTQSSRQAGQADNTADSINQRSWATSRFEEQEHHNSFAPALRKKEDKKNSDRCTAFSGDGQSGDSISQGQIATIKYRKDYEDNLVASIKPRSLRSSGRHSVDGSSIIQRNFVNSDISRLDSSIELEGDYAVRSGEESSDRSPRTLLRVRSVPAALNGERAHPSEPAEAVPETFAIIPEADATKLVDPSTRSTLSRKVAGLKGSFTFSKKKSHSIKEIDESSPGKEEAFAIDSVKEVISSKECEQNGLQDYESVPFTDVTLENSASPESAVDESKDLLDVDIERLGTVSQVHEVTSLEESLILTDDQESISDCEGQSFEGSSSSKDCDNSHQLLVCASDDAIPSSDVQLLKENPEQPSPVSVLDAPFEDETVISAEFKEIKSDLQELRKRLDLLKFEEHDQDSEQEALPQASSSISPSTHEGDSDATNIRDDNLSSVASNELKPSFPCVEKLGYSDGYESQIFTYVKDVLAATGYTGLDSGILPQPYTLGQLLDPVLFQQMESVYCNKVSEVDTESCKQSEKPFDLSMRHLLFDCVGEVLQEILGSDDNLSLFLRPVRPSLLPKLSGNELVKHVSEKVQALADSQLEVQDTLENLVTKDLAKGCQWFDFSDDKEGVALDIEKGILDDLMEETLLVL